MRYMEYRAPAALEQIHRVLAIPTKKTDAYLVKHLSMEEMQFILDAPDSTVGHSGSRHASSLLRWRITCL
jgi:hypothetical protein